ncbi:MAG: helix-turn-helix domain-containing protein [Dehalococcoidia bacterium]|nr:helix-turn-helix domain-containing protein [Dehalococcoidia bacterium]
MPKPITSSTKAKKPRPPRASAAERALTTEQNAVRREVAAYWLAIGVTQQRAADECGVDLRTVQRWCAEQDFQQHVADLRQQAFAEIEPQMWANVRLALDVERRMLNGEVQGDDPAWGAAKSLLDRFRGLALSAEAPPPPGGGGPGGVAVTVYANGERRDEPDRPRRDVIDQAP